jgi:hypothetical protein
MYAEVIPYLLLAKVHVLKEKPAGSSTNELQYLQQLAPENSTRLVTEVRAVMGTVMLAFKNGFHLSVGSIWREELANCV